MANLDKIKANLSRGVTVNDMMVKLKINRRPFYYYRTLDPAFNQFVLDATQNKGVRRSVRAVRVHVATVHEQNNDYHAIRAMIPESNPHRDDIVARIFEDLLGGSLKRDEVPARLKVYIA